MIKLNQISKSIFKTKLLRNKKSAKWFIWYVQNKIDGIHFYSLEKDNLHFGVCFFIFQNYNTEIGILINNEYQNKGLGSALINQLLLNSKKPLIFKVSINNTISSNFLMKFVNIGVLSFQKDKSNLVFKSI